MALITTLPPIDGRLVMMGLVLPYYAHVRWLEGSASASVQYIAAVPSRVAFRQQLLTGSAWSRRRDYRRVLEAQQQLFHRRSQHWLFRPLEEWPER